MWDALQTALTVVTQPQHLLYVLLGACLGLLIGLMPGMGGTVGMAILLPFVYGMDPNEALALLVGALATTNIGDTFPAVMLGVPGTAASQATILDGYPLARKGHAATALGAGFSSSMIGGVIGGLFLLGLLFAARPLVLLLGPPELLMLITLGLSMVALLSRSSRTAGLTAAALGLLLGSVGTAPATSAFRFTFDTQYLIGGIPLPVFALGLFAVPEVIDLLVRREAIAGNTGLHGSRAQGIRATLRNSWLVLQSSALGVFIGLLPGLGGSVAQWISYGFAKETVRGADKTFGKGDIRGLIAPEATHNSDHGGTLLPTLAFGIPGNGSTAVLLAGFTLMGLQPGPSMIEGKQLSVSLAMVWSLVLANLIGGFIALVLSAPAARLTAIPARKLMPVVMVTIVLAAYQSTTNWLDVVIMFGIGAVAWVMKHAGWPRPPMLIGFVLAKPAEQYLLISTNRYGLDWLARPGVIVLTVVILGVVLLPTLRRFNRRGRVDLEETHTHKAETEPAP